MESLSTAKMIKSVVGHSTDLIKDIILCIQISMSQGGLSELMKQKKLYIRGVSTNLQDKINLLGFFGIKVQTYLFVDIFCLPWFNNHSIVAELSTVYLKWASDSLW